MPAPSSSLPSSPSSSSSQLPTPQYPLPLTYGYLYDTYGPGALHLVPCTVDQYFDLPFGSEDKYELVKGILWSKGEMISHTHDETRDRIAAELSGSHGDQGYEVVIERTVDASPSSGGASIRSRPPSSPSSLSQQHPHTIRRLEIAVFQPSRAPNRAALSPKSNNFTFPRDYPPLLAIEITSPSTRNVDLFMKWDEYERAAVHCYVIVVCADERNPSVVVGTLSNGRYNRIVYRGDDVVHLLLFDELEFSAQYLLDPPRSITEIRNSPIIKLNSMIRDRDRDVRDLDRINRDKSHAPSDLHRTFRDLTRQLPTQRGHETTTSKAHRSSGKQSASSSSPSCSASKGHSPSEGNSPSKPPKNKKSKLKK